jgi:hypothetical protein
MATSIHNLKLDDIEKALEEWLKKPLILNKQESGEKM